MYQSHYVTNRLANTTYYAYVTCVTQICANLSVLPVGPFGYYCVIERLSNKNGHVGFKQD